MNDDRTTPGGAQREVHDPVAARRARIARLSARGKRVAYAALLLAIVAFAVAVATGFPAGLVIVAVAGLTVFCVVAPVPIILGYGVRAAARDDRARKQL